MLRLAVAVSTLLFAPAVSAQIVWNAATEYPSSAVSGQGLTTFARLVGEKTAGALVIELSFDASSGTKSAGMLAAVQDGRIQIGDAFAGALATTDPVFALSSLPFLATSVEDARRLNALARPAYEAALAGSGQRLLYTTPWPPTGLWSLSPLSGPDLLAHLKVRTYDETSRNLMNSLGATATNISFADALAKLKDGSVDAVLSSGDGGAGRRLWDYLRYFTEIGYAMPVSIATVSKVALEALPPDQRTAVLQAAEQTEARQWAAIVTRQEENHRRLRENGVSVQIQPSPALAARLRVAADPIVARWTASSGPAAAAVLAAFQSSAR